LVSDIKGETETEGVSELGSQENIGLRRNEMTGGLRKLHK
jgi:hypothetical protein